MMHRIALIAGASGLIGGELLSILLTNDCFSQVKVLVRSRLDNNSPKLVQIITDYDTLDNNKSQLGCDVLFCCLGSTRKKTPNLSDYRKIDHCYPFKLASLCKAAGMSQFHFVSALGANSSSKNFYSRMKGETEDALNTLDIPALYIYQPSLLTGNRIEFRLAEKLAIYMMRLLNPLLIGSLKKYKSIKAKSIACAMFNQSMKGLHGTFVYTSDKIITLA